MASEHSKGVRAAARAIIEDSRNGPPTMKGRGIVEKLIESHTHAGEWQEIGRELVVLRDDPAMTPEARNWRLLAVADRAEKLLDADKEGR